MGEMWTERGLVRHRSYLKSDNQFWLLLSTCVIFGKSRQRSSYENFGWWSVVPSIICQENTLSGKKWKRHTHWLQNWQILYGLNIQALNLSVLWTPAVFFIFDFTFHKVSLASFPPCLTVGTLFSPSLCKGKVILFWCFWFLCVSGALGSAWGSSSLIIPFHPHATLLPVWS